MRPTTRTVVGSLVGPALVVVAGAALQRPPLAVAGLVAAFVVTQAALLAPDRLAAVVAAVGGAVGRSVSWLLLGVLYAVVFLPVAAVAWVFGVGPLGQAPAWAPHRRDRLRPGRTFADDRAPRRPGVAIGFRPALGLLLVGALAAGLGVAVVDRFEDDELDPGQIPAAVDLFASPAMADAPWAADLRADDATAEGATTYAPFLGLALADRSTRYVNVSGRERDSYEPATPRPEPLEVWFFGGSTMFGTGQRDDHTIPSEFARLTEARGLDLHVRNFGVPSAVNIQETVLLAQLLLSGGRPDLVVFYDGFNDTAAQLIDLVADGQALGTPAGVGTTSNRLGLAGHATATAAAPTPIGPGVELGRPPRLEAVADAVRQAYAPGVVLARRLSDRYGFTIEHFWQPSIYTKSRLDPGEDALLDAIGVDRASFDALTHLQRLLRNDLPAGVLDVADALDDAEGPILMDQVHTNEAGAALVAGAMLDHLLPDLPGG